MKNKIFKNNMRKNEKNLRIKKKLTIYIEDRFRYLKIDFKNYNSYISLKSKNSEN